MLAQVLAHNSCTGHAKQVKVCEDSSEAKCFASHVQLSWASTVVPGCASSVYTLLHHALPCLACLGLSCLVCQCKKLVLCAGLVLPRLPKAALPLAVGTVGALIMPHNMYLQSAVVQSRYHTSLGLDEVLFLIVRQELVHVFASAHM